MLGRPINGLSSNNQPPSSGPNMLTFKRSVRISKYNCAGLAFRSYKYLNQKEMLETVRQMRHVSCDSVCNPFDYKFWVWTFQLGMTNLTSKHVYKSHADFHIISGRTDYNGEGPDLVISKNGRRPVMPPGDPLSWKPKTGIYLTNDALNTPQHDNQADVSNLTQTCYCSEQLPGLG